MKTKEVNYFDMFIEAAKICEKAAALLEEMLIGDITKIPERVRVIHEFEHEGDDLYHKLYYHLNRAFITPIERDDILEVAMNIECTLDTIDEIAIMFDIMFIRSIRPEAKEFVKLIMKNAKTLVEATKEFESFKKSKKLSPLLVEINRIEEEGDKLYQNTIRHLFANEKDVLEVVKWKSVFDTMENALDACEKTAETMENVILKNT